MSSVFDLHIPPIHPAIQKFPEMSSADIDALAADIEKNGQRQPVVLYQGRIWDGRARVEACRRLRKQPRYWLIRNSDEPFILLIQQNYKRFGEPKSPERYAALDIVHLADSPDWLSQFKKQKEEWIAEARREFRFDSIRALPCAVCNQHVQMVHAHHSLPLNIQFALGVVLADHAHDWLCPLHHRMIHVCVSIFMLDTKTGEFLEGLRPDSGLEWEKVLNVFDRGLKLFEKLGGQRYSTAAFNHKYPHWGIRK